jgi:hypothetical protein
VPTYPLLKLSDVIVVRHASSSTRLKTARYHLARLVRASPRCRQRDGPGRRALGVGGKCWRQIRCARIAKSTYIEFPSLEVKEKRNG